MADVCVFPADHSNWPVKLTHYLAVRARNQIYYWWTGVHIHSFRGNLAH